MTKLCKHCGEVKPTERFGKHKQTKDGLQNWCTDCRGISRTKIMKADKNSVVYMITNPIGEVYVGSTKQFPKYRFMFHKAQHKHNPGMYPLIHNSFDIYGFENHTFEVIKELGDISRKELRENENIYILKYKAKGISLNKNQSAC